MKLSTRLVAGTFATVAITVGMTTVTATNANAALIDSLDGDNWVAHNKLNRVAYPGMFIDFDGDFSDGMIGNMCTLGAVGTDSAGRKVGITAGHCNPQTFRPTVHEGVTYPNAPKFLGAQRDVVVTTNDHPVFDRNAARWATQVADETNQPVVLPNPIGWIRWVDGDTCDLETNEIGSENRPCSEDPGQTDLQSKTDYMVIEFASDVQLSSQVYGREGNPVQSTAGGNKLFKVNSTLTNSSGTPILPGLFSRVEIYGARTDRDPDLQSAVISTPSQGWVTGLADGMIRAHAGFSDGDSGGPVVEQGTGKWVGIVTAPTAVSRHHGSTPPPRTFSRTFPVV